MTFSKKIQSKLAAVFRSFVKKAKPVIQVTGEMLSRNKELAANVGAVVVIIAVGIVLFTSKPNRPPFVPSKSAVIIDVLSNAKTASSGGATLTPESADTEIQWRKSVDISDQDLSVDGTIIEEIKPNQEFAGGLDLPKDWTVQYSTDPLGTAAGSRTYQDYYDVSQNEPSAATLKTITYLKISTGTTDGVKPAAKTDLVKPLSEQQVVTPGAKPSVPVKYNNKLYMVLNGVRATGTNMTLDCYDLITFARCTDHTYPTFFSSTGASSATPTALGSNSRNIHTAVNSQITMDDGTYGHEGRIYFPGQSGTSYGVTCVDIRLYQNCGFTTLGTSTAPTGTNPVLVSGFIKSGSKLYGHANDADKAGQTIVCFDMATSAICSGYSANPSGTTQTAVNPTYLLSEHGGSYDNTGTHVMSGDNMYWIINYRLNNTRITDFIFDEYTSQRSYGTILACYNVVSNSRCASPFGYNWPRQFDNTLPTYERPNNIFIWKDSNGSDKAVCYIASNGAPEFDPALPCYGVSGGGFGVQLSGGVGTGWPAIMPNPSRWMYVPWIVGPNTTSITDTQGHQRTYFPVYRTDLADRGATLCFDWTTQAACAGLPALKYWSEPESNYRGDQGYVYDGSCMLRISQSGYLNSFDPMTGLSPCRVARGTFTASLNANDFYCDGQAHLFSWRKAKLTKSSMFDFQSMNVDVRNASNSTSLISGDIKGPKSLDLSSVDYNSNPSVYVSVNSTVWNTSPWANSARPYISLSANGDTVQYCYKTKAKTYATGLACDITALTTGSSATFVSEDNTYTDATDTDMPITQLSNKQCFKDLRVSVSKSALLIVNGQNLTYTITVENKANTDTEHRGDIGGIYNAKTARYEAVLPNGVQFISASDGGTYDANANKVTWSNQAIAAASTVQRTVTVKAPGQVARLNSGQASLAASQQNTLTMQAAAYYDDDVYPADNSVSDAGVVHEQNTAPVISNFSESHNTLRAPADITFSATVTDDNALSSIELLRDGVSVGTMTSTGTADQYSLELTSVSSGAHSYRVRAIDTGSPTLTTTSDPISLTVTPANTAPTISSFTQTNTTLISPATLHFVANITDDYGLTNVGLYSSGNLIGTMTETDSGKYEVRVSNYQPGSYSFEVRAADEGTPQLTTTSSTITLAVVSPPSISNFSESHNTLRAPANITFTATVTDDSGLTSVVLLRDGIPAGTMSSTGITNQFGLTLYSVDAGSHTYAVLAADNGSPPLSTTSNTVSVTVTPANTAPTINSFTQSSTDLTAPATLRFAANISDDYGLTSVNLYSGNTLIGPISPTGSGRFEVNIFGYLAGSYDFTVRATDEGSPQLTTTSTPLSITVVNPILAPASPEPNKAPVLSDFAQTTNNPSEPASLNFTINATDDAGLSKLELYKDNDPVGFMVPTTTASVFALTIPNITEGEYQFKVIASDGASPPLSTTSEPLSVKVAKRAAPTDPGSTNRQNTAQTKPEAPKSAPEAFIEGVNEVVTTAVKPIPRKVAFAIPYGNITLLSAYAMVYLLLALRQSHDRRRVQALLQRFRRTQANQKNFIDLTSHYLNTPITTMQTTLEMFKGIKALPAASISAMTAALSKLAKDARETLNKSEKTKSVTAQTNQALSKAQAAHTFASPALLIPIIGVFITGIMLNVVFISAGKYANSIVNTAVQSSLYILGAFALVGANVLLRREKIASATAAQELQLEQSLIEVQSGFIGKSSDLLSEDTADLESATPPLSKVKFGPAFTSSLHSLSRIVKKMSYLKNVNRKGKNVDYPRIDLHAVIDEVVTPYRKVAQDKQIDFETQFSSRLTAKIDNDDFAQILSSILDNAFKFTEAGGNIRCSSVFTKNTLSFTVTDTGVGIAKDKIDQLFSPFSRATDTEVFNYEGIGLDLYINKILLEQAGGSIKLTSKVGEGTTIKITLQA